MMIYDDIYISWVLNYSYPMAYQNIFSHNIITIVSDTNYFIYTTDTQTFLCYKTQFAVDNIKTYFKSIQIPIAYFVHPTIVLFLQQDLFHDMLTYFIKIHNG